MVWWEVVSVHTDRPECPDCHIPMEDHMQAFHSMGKFYPALKCPKCNRVMLHTNTANAIADDCWKERAMNWREHDRIVRKVLITEGWIEPDDKREGEELARIDQNLSYFVRRGLKYQIKTNKKCPRCGTEDIRVKTERACGDMMTCNNPGCHHKWFYEHPEKKENDHGPTVEE